MNNFSLKRTGLLIAKQWAENRRMYWVSVLALTGILGITFAFWLMTSGNSFDEGSTYVFGLIGLYITGAIFASTSFNMVHKKDTGIYWISFPASHFEKFLVTLFFNVIVFTVVYVVCFSVLKLLAETYIQMLIDKGERHYSYRKADWSEKKEFSKAFYAFSLAFFSVQALFLVGAVSFKRFAFIFTTVFLAAFIFVNIWMLAKISRGFFEGYNFDLFSVRKYNYTATGREDTYLEYMIPPGLKDSIIFFLKFLIAPFLWLVTWFKLKEKQI